MINIDQIIEKKKQIKASLEKLISIEVKEFKDLGLGDGIVKFRPLTADEWDEIQEKKGNNDKDIIYNNCVSPNLKDEKLLKAFNCSLTDDVEPVEVVNKLLSTGAQASICKVIILKSNLYARDDMVEVLDDEIKN